jgi:hypothetical protein
LFENIHENPLAIFSLFLLGNSQAFGPNSQVSWLQEIPCFGQISGRRHFGGDKVRFRKTLPHFPGLFFVVGCFFLYYFFTNVVTNDESVY